MNVFPRSVNDPFSVNAAATSAPPFGSSAARYARARFALISGSTAMAGQVAWSVMVERAGGGNRVRTVKTATTKKKEKVVMVIS